MKKKFGHYEVVSELGKGGMGVVYKAFEPTLNRYVAIKALGDHLLGDKDLIERFTREAKSMAALSHPNVIQVYYIGMEGEQPYFSMEFIKGVSLDALLRGNKVFSVPHAREILRQACAGLEVAHQAGLVHRDIKPANLMMAEDGTVKVVDFGIARTREYGDKLTNTGEFVGTPGYLSPEVCTGVDVDARSDIFALGIVFYEMLAGKVPFENESPLGLMLEVVQSDIPDIRELNRKVDRKTSYILQKMIAKNPQERFQSCQEIIDQLGPSTVPLSIDDIRQQAVSVKVKSKTRISEIDTLPSAAAVTKNSMVAVHSKKSVGGKKWLSLAAALLVVSAGVFGYVQGYLPIPQSMVGEQPELAGNDSGSGQDGALQMASLSAGVTPPGNASGSTTDSGGLLNTLSGVLGSDSNSDPATDAGQGTQAQNNDALATQTAAITRGASDPGSNDNGALQNGQIVNDPGHDPEQLVVDRTVAHVDTQAMSKQGVESRPVARKAPVLDKGVAVIAFGDPAVAHPIEKILEAELKGNNIKVLNEQFIPGMGRMMSEGVDLARLRETLMQHGGSAMVIAHVNHIGEQELNYYGRTSQLINAQLDIDSFDLLSGDSLGSGYGAKLSYTALNATEQAEMAVMGYMDELKSTLRGR